MFAAEPGRFREPSEARTISRVSDHSGSVTHADAGPDLRAPQQASRTSSAPAAGRTSLVANAGVTSSRGTAEVRFADEPSQPAGWRIKWREPQIAVGNSLDQPHTSAKPSAGATARQVAAWSDDEEGPSLGEIRPVSQRQPAGSAGSPRGSTPSGTVPSNPVPNNALPSDSAPTETAPSPSGPRSSRDPFRNPFGERPTAPSVESPSEGAGGAPRLNVPNSDAAPAPPDPSLNQPPPSIPDPRPSTRPRDDDAAPPPPVTRTPFTVPEIGQGYGNPVRRPCDRTYNERNCCDDEDRCRVAADALKLRYRDISQASLNITPSIKPDARSKADMQRYKDDTLAKTPVRDWKTRDGQLAARGRMKDLENGAVLVEDESGQVRRIKLNSLTTDDMCFISAWWGTPTKCIFERTQSSERAWEPLEVTWKASGLCHKPLYFEEPQLERYGHTTGPIAEPFVSGAHFFTNIALIPYKMGIHPPTECQYALGYYRPGSCAPWLLPPFPLSVRGGLAEAGVVTGLIFILP